MKKRPQIIGLGTIGHVIATTLAKSNKVVVVKSERGVTIAPYKPIPIKNEPIMIDGLNKKKRGTNRTPPKKKRKRR